PAADTSETETVRKKSTRKAVKRSGLAKGLIDVKSEVSKPEFPQAAFELAGGNLPLYYPSVRLAEGGYTTTDGVRAYEIVSRTKKRYAAFRLSLYYGENGQYYGVQGTSWRNPPILAEQHRTITRSGRKLELYGAPGGRYRLIAWKTPRGVYWVSNTISNRLSNAQMLDIASNLRRVPG
ncbi:MAG: hypothetical protein Q7T55_10430, partial [Solirubrobacteraceae bacterium]|nr:hypothetical protein [Solirubrobacteraceae bacterium]